MSISGAVIVVGRAARHARQRRVTMVISIAMSVLMVVGLSGFFDCLRSFNSRVSDLLATPVSVTRAFAPTPGGNGAKGLGMAEFDALSGGIDHAVTASVLPIMYGSGVMRHEGRSYRTAIVGSTSEYPRVGYVDVIAGTLFSDEQYRDGSRVVLIGPVLVDSLFGGDMSAALGHNVLIGRLTFRVIGIIGSDGKGRSSNTTALVSLTAARQYLFGEGRRDLNAIALLPASPSQIMPTVQRAEEILDRLHLITSADRRDFTVSYSSVIPTLVELFGALAWAFVSVIGAILLASAYWLIKIIRVPATGRRRVIYCHGVRATGRTLIFGRILMESILASAFGGVVGLTLGAVVIVIQRQTLPSISPLYTLPQISLQAISFTLSLVLLIGILTGVYGIFRVSLQA